MLPRVYLVSRIMYGSISALRRINEHRWWSHEASQSAFIIHGGWVRHLRSSGAGQGFRAVAQPMQTYEMAVSARSTNFRLGRRAVEFFSAPKSDGVRRRLVNLRLRALAERRASGRASVYLGGRYTQEPPILIDDFCWKLSVGSQEANIRAPVCSREGGRGFLFYLIARKRRQWH